MMKMKELFDSFILSIPEDVLLFTILGIVFIPGMLMVIYLNICDIVNAKRSKHLKIYIVIIACVVILIDKMRKIIKSERG